MKEVLLFLTLLFLGYAGRGQCDMGFTITMQNGTRQVHFESHPTASRPGTRFEFAWEFGDGDTSSMVNPTHTYTQLGNYNVCVRVKELLSSLEVCDSVFCIRIDVTDQSYCNTDLQVEGYGKDMDFVLYSNDNDHDFFFLDYGDGSRWAGTSAYGFKAYHTYAQPGLYEVCLTAFNLDANNKPICVGSTCTEYLAQDTSSYKASYTYNITGNQVTFTNTSRGAGYRSKWYFGDGDSSIAASPAHTYPGAGIYYPQLVIEKQVGNFWYVSDAVIDTIVVGNPAPVCRAMFKPRVLLGNRVHFINYSSINSNTAFVWDLGDGTQGPQWNALHTYGAPGVYDVCLMSFELDGNGGILCSDTFCLQVSVGNTDSIACNAYFEYLPTTSTFLGQRYHVNFDNQSAGRTFTNHWDLGNGTTSAIGTPQLSYATAGSYPVCLTINDQDGCTDTYCDTVYVNDCSTYFAWMGTPANSNSIAFNIPLAGFLITDRDYTFDFGDGNVSAPQTTAYIDHHYAAPGKYYVCMESNNRATGCSYTYCDTVTVEYMRGWNLSGYAYTDGGSVLRQGTVYLIEQNGNILKAIDSTHIYNFGDFSFTNVSSGQYLLKAALLPTDPGYHDFLPTYYGDSLFWSDATPINLTQDTTGFVIHMVQGSNPGGPGFVGGNVFQGANKMLAEGDPIGGVQVMLLNMDNSAVQYTLTLANGTYSFTNVAYGTYKVYAEVMGKPTHFITLTVDAENEIFEEVNIAITDDAVYAAIGREPKLLQGVKLYPNPTEGKLFLDTRLADAQILQITIADVYGQQAYTETFAAGHGTDVMELGIVHLPAGIYLIIVTNANAEQAVYRIAKHY